MARNPSNRSDGRRHHHRGPSLHGARHDRRDGRERDDIRERSRRLRSRGHRGDEKTRRVGRSIARLDESGDESVGDAAMSTAPAKYHYHELKKLFGDYHPTGNMPCFKCNEPEAWDITVAFAKF